jgi:uncharacterized lipoprotein NlpE involved in copper resistance
LPHNPYEQKTQERSGDHPKSKPAQNISQHKKSRQIRLQGTGQMRRMQALIQLRPRLRKSIMSRQNKLNQTHVTCLYRGAILVSTLLLTACSQMQQSGYYNLPTASSATDAQAQAESAYATQAVRPPNQIQIGLKSSAPAQQQTGGNATANPTPGATVATAVAATAPDTVRSELIPEPQTFAGTLPCFHPEMKCVAQRVTVTMSPNGRWRARAAYLGQNNKTSQLADQGCWRATAQAVPRIVLLNNQNNVRAELAMTSTNVLRLISINGDLPNLTYTLTRQPDLDPINELNNQTSPSCP